MDLQRVADELEIAALLNRYARAVDAKDWQLYRSVFTDDAHIDYSSAGAAAGPRDEVAAWLEQGFGAIPMSMHYITNVKSWRCTAIPRRCAPCSTTPCSCRAWRS